MTVSILSIHHVITLLVHHVIQPAHPVSAFTLGACDGNPCMNGGQCIDMGTEANPKQFTCACAEGYTGLTCQKRIDPCADEPCQNGGICEPRGEHFHCSCTQRFKGKLCEQYIRKRNPCLGDPCGAHGYCEVVNYDFICECSPGYHGSRCEFEEDDEIVEEEEEDDDDDDEDPEIVAIEEDKAQSDSRKALVIGEIVLAFFVVFVFILILCCIHWVRVANKRSGHQAAQELRMVAGKDVEPTPGWFETSNTLCYDFFCYCCRLVNKYENERHAKKVVIGNLRNNSNTKDSFERGVHNENFATIEESKYPGQSSFRDAGLGEPAPPAARPVSVPGSKRGSQASSRQTSRQPSRTASAMGPPEDRRPGAENDPECNASANQRSNSCWSVAPSVDWSQNRADLPYYNVARHYPVMPSKPRSPGRPAMKMADGSRRAEGGGGSRTARGSLPGFQPGSSYLQADAEEFENEAVPQMPHKVRVRRSMPPHGRSNRALVDISDCDDEDDDEDDEIDELEDDDDGAMVGPSGNILPMPFRGGVRMERDAGNVDELYFDEAQCSNQSNSFQRRQQTRPYSDSRGNGYDAYTERQRYDPRYARGGNLYNGSRNNAAGNESDEGDEGGDDFSDSPDDNDDDDDNDYNYYDNGAYENNNVSEYYEEADNVYDDEDDDGADDDDDDDDNDDRPQYLPPPRPPPRRRARRIYHRYGQDAAHDDGYSSTGRMSESDAGGRSRDPVSVEAVTRQARRNFYSRQPHTPAQPQTQSSSNGRPRGRVSRQELADSSARRGQQERLGITLSPHSSAPATQPVVFNHRVLSPQQTSAPLNTSSPLLAPPMASQSPAPVNHEQLYHPQHSQQQHTHQYRRYSTRPGDTRDSSSGQASSRRPRSSLQGWDRSASRGGLAPSSAPPLTQATPTASQHLQQQQQQQQLLQHQHQHSQQPPRRQKVKGILKKTSAYDTSSRGRRVPGRMSRNAHAAGFAQSDYNYNHSPKAHLMAAPPPYPPPAYDGFLS